MPALITTGDDVRILVPLTKDGATFAIADSATVEAQVLSTDRSTALSAKVTCSRLASGADWSTGVVIVTFTAAESAAITLPDSGRARLEVQVNDSGKTTWSGLVELVRGVIP